LEPGLALVLELRLKQALVLEQVQVLEQEPARVLEQQKLLSLLMCPIEQVSHLHL